MKCLIVLLKTILAHVVILVVAKLFLVSLKKIGKEGDNLSCTHAKTA